MDPTVAKRQGRHGAAHRLRRRSLVVAVTIGLSTMSSAAAAAAGPALHTTPLGKKSLCTGVQPSAISKVVGYAVPRATMSTQTEIIDRKRNVSASQTFCSYGAGTTAVVLGYETLSSPLPFPVLEQDLKASATANKPAGATYTIAHYEGLGVQGLYESESGSITLEAILGVQGDKIAGALLEKTKPKKEVAALTELAMANFF